MPFVVDRLPAVADGVNSAALVLSGMSILLGIFVVVAGVLSFIVKD